MIPRAVPRSVAGIACARPRPPNPVLELPARAACRRGSAAGIITLAPSPLELPQGFPALRIVHGAPHLALSREELHTPLASPAELDLSLRTGEDLPGEERIGQGLARLGVCLDPKRNDQVVGGTAGPITAEGSAVPIWVVPTDEELMIARDARCVVSGGAAG